MTSNQKPLAPVWGFCPLQLRDNNQTLSLAGLAVANSMPSCCRLSTRAYLKMRCRRTGMAASPYPMYLCSECLTNTDTKYVIFLKVLLCSEIILIDVTRYV